MSARMTVAEGCAAYLAEGERPNTPNLGEAFVPGAVRTGAALLPLFDLTVPSALLGPLAHALASLCRQVDLAGVDLDCAHAHGIITGQLSAKALTMTQVDLLQKLVNKVALGVRADITGEAPRAPTVGGAA